jgi:murein L,D-transpeptidase YcbB/YkuD
MTNLDQPKKSMRVALAVICTFGFLVGLSVWWLQRQNPLIPAEAKGLSLRASLELQQSLEALLKEPQWAYLQPSYSKYASGIGHGPLWLSDAGIKGSAYDVVKVIEDLGSHGLDSAEFHSPAVFYKVERLLRAKKGKHSLVSPILWAELELSLTADLSKLESQLRFGKVNPRLVDPEWFIDVNKSSLPLTFEKLSELIQQQKIREYIEDLVPKNQQYQKLRQVLLQHQKWRVQGAWKTVPTEGRWRLGVRDPKVVPLIRQRLEASADIAIPTSATENRDLFDRILLSGVQHFQRRHGLEPNGRVEAETLQQLNIPIEDRILDIRANLERWRWLPREQDQQYLLVNIADFKLELIKNDQPQLRMNVVVGKNVRRTPSFHSAIEALELNPKWYVPRTLALEDFLLQLQQEPERLSQMGYRVYSAKNGEELNLESVEWVKVRPETFEYLLVQDAGPHNALGRIKFWLPNSFGIYLHDTPAKDLFERRTRTFSSGCIRLEKPRTLAQALLVDNQIWDAKRFQSFIDSGKNHRISLKKSMPIKIQYWTAWVDEEDVVQFRPDVYQRNVALKRALADKRATP